ncbi:helix-turn-helix domain-containing protein [Micromonospora sp. NBC_01813]|uniref:helix-turn-helix domain-containing protein n=1 Tax=Micromonospora sp. NBC_01813 TaxID=2975988 RepID=UPI002DDA2F91|nr:helix-turn-helix transcriptional regulator [Micromonospora sp. NBC_01813]WSA10030.1 helix-turn-helix transcriptional regulator [Micromonospora sp. NBC_01813]
MAKSPSEFLIWDMRRRRTAEGLTQEQWAARLHYSHQHVSSIERGRRPALPDYLAMIDREFSTSFVAFYEEFVLAEAEPVWLREWTRLEREALMLRWFEALVVPGLLQTEAYATAVLTEAGLRGSTAERVAARLARQEVLRRKDPVLRFLAVIDQAVLTRPVGGPAVMSEQLDAILTACALPNVSVQVVPTDVGAYPGVNGPFVVATVEDGIYGYLDNQLAGQVVGSRAEVADLVETWEALRSYALSERQSIELIKEVKQSWT